MDFSRYIYATCLGLYRFRGWLVSHLTPVGFGVVAMLIVSGLVGLGSSQSMSHLLFFLSLSLLGLAFIGRRFVQLSFKAERVLPRFGTVDEPLRYRVLLKNLSAHPQPGLKITETVPTDLPTYHEFFERRQRYYFGWKGLQALRQNLAKRQWAIAPLIDLPMLKARGKTEVTHEIIPLRRGLLNLETLTIAASDPLGLSYQRFHLDLPESVCILPPRYDLPPMFSVGRRAHQMGDAVLTSSVGESSEFRALRDYRPGDPTNKIHWKSWAKVGRPMVREQQDESAAHYGLILDTFHPEPESEVFEEAVAIATSIITQVQGISVLLDVIFAAQDLQCITAGPSNRKKDLLLEMMATITPCQTLLFEEFIPLVHSRLPRLSSCVCLFIQWDETRHAFLETLAQYNIPIKAMVLCEEQHSHQGLRYISLTPSCTVYFISLNQVQQDLLQL